MSLPDYLRQCQRDIEGYAREYGLDFFDTVFEVVDSGAPCQEGRPPCNPLKNAAEGA